MTVVPVPLIDTLFYQTLQKGTCLDAPIPLTEYPTPPFPTDTIPQPARSWVQAVAKSLQTPADLPSMLLLAVAAAAVGGRVAIRAAPTWVEPLNLFVVVVLPPATRKSAAFSLATAPLAAYEAHLIDAQAPAMATQESRRKIAEAALARLQQEAARADPEQRERLLAEADRQARALRALPVVAVPRLIVDDCSPEKVGALLAEQGGRLAVLSPEAGVFDLMAGRYSGGGGGNYDVYLKGHAGDALRVDRIGRPPDLVPQPSLTVGLTVQPEVLQGLADKPGFRGRGLLGRFLYSVPESLVGRRDPNPPPLPPTIRTAYADLITALLRLPIPTAEAGRPVPAILELSAEADTVLRAFEAAVEPRLGEFGDLGPIADWGGKLVGAVARISGVHHLVTHAYAPTPWRIPIAGETMVAATQIGGYLAAHAKVAFGQMAADPVVADAKVILRFLTQHQLTAVSKRDMFKAMEGRFRRVSALEPALRVLVRHHYLAEQPAPLASGPGRKPSPVFDVNPALFMSTNGRNADHSGDCGECADSDPPAGPDGRTVD